MRLFKSLRSMGRKLFGGAPTYDGVGGGRRALAWSVGNPGAVAALLFTQHELRAKSRDLVRRNAWANSALESYVANAIGTGIKPQSMAQDATVREAIQALWRDWTVDALSLIHIWCGAWGGTGRHPDGRGCDHRRQETAPGHQGVLGRGWHCQTGVLQQPAQVSRCGGRWLSLIHI